MRKLSASLFLAFLLGAATINLIQVALGQGIGDLNILNQETQGENRREITGPPQAETPLQPNIGFIDSPSVTCYQPDASRDECFINWYYLSVNASPNYMVTMTVTLNQIGPVAHTHGFFQTSMYVPYNMLGDGFKVACGPLNGGGNPDLGHAYAYTIRARDSANLSSANYGTVFCPAYQP